LAAATKIPAVRLQATRNIATSSSDRLLKAKVQCADGRSTQMKDLAEDSNTDSA
jgi:hypothetical protein